MTDSVFLRPISTQGNFLGIGMDRNVSFVIVTLSFTLMTVLQKKHLCELCPEESHLVWKQAFKQLTTLP